MFIYFPSLICVVGLVLYLLVDKPKITELARIMFAIGLLVVLFNGVKSLL